MPQPTAFHPRTSAACQSLAYKEWAGYYAVCRYDVSVEPEYFAIRERAGLLDISPLFKYDITGPDATTLIDRMVARDATRLEAGQVAYSCWCNEDGHIIDDGALFCFAPDRWRVTAANPNFLWLSEVGEGLKVTIQDRSASLAALALQGPKSREVLSQLTDADLTSLGFFRTLETSCGGSEVTISRTGFTGDLGYELWIEQQHALTLWDQLLEAGGDYGLEPVGLDALDMTRVEAGLLLIDCDFNSAFHCLNDNQKSTPYELGFDWMVHLNKERSFIGQRALAQARRRGPDWKLVGLEIDMEHLEELYRRRRLPIALCPTAWRSRVPLYDSSRKQVGYATSGVWSPLLKKNLALATVDSRLSKVGTRLTIEAMVEFDREYVPVTVVQTPFFDPPRKRA